MIKFGSLSSEELVYICSHIPVQLIRQYFKKTPKKFAEIVSGFRPEKISEEKARSILVNNVNNDYIASFLDHSVSGMILKVQEQQSFLVKEGNSEEEALVLSVIESDFTDNCGLYFKLCEQDVSEDYIRLFDVVLSLVNKATDNRNKKEQEKVETKNQALLEEAREEISSLKDQLSESKKNEVELSAQIETLKETISSKEDEIEAIHNDLQNASLIKDEMQARLDNYQSRERFSDDICLPDDVSEFQHVSIGQVYRDYSDQLWISRLADIIQGEIVPFVLDENSPRYFDNRDRLFWRDGPDNDNSIGVWGWRAEPNYSDATKDYVTSVFFPFVKATEVIELPYCKSVQDISKILINWFEISFSTSRFLFSYTTSNGEKEGILCSIEDFEVTGDKARLKPSVVLLPHYIIKSSDIIRLNGVQFYRFISFGIPFSVVKVRTPNDVIKQLLLARVTIPALRENGLTKKEAQKCKLFLENIPVDTIIQEMTRVYACSDEEAQEYISSFVDHAETYLSESDLDTNIISSALERNAGLIELCKIQLYEEWKKDYSAKIEEAERKLSEAEQAEGERRLETESLIQKKEELIQEIDRIRDSIDAQERFAKDVELKVEERIKAAQQNASEFVSQMAFILPLINKNNQAEVTQKQNPMPVRRSSIDHSEQEQVDDLDTFEEELTGNLMAIGYSDIVATEMAQAISFCICNRLPIVVRENSTVIAQCVAATIGGEELTEVFVSSQSSMGAFLDEVIIEDQKDYPYVRLFHGVFDGYSNNLFNEITNLIQNSKGNMVAILSLQGIAPKMIYDSIWANAFYIDGDEGIERIPAGSVHAVQPLMQFSRDLDEKEYKTRWRELQPFSSLISNKQRCWYAKYLAEYGIQLNDSPTILNQIITVARSNGLEERLSELYKENGIVNGEEILEKNMG